MQTSPSVILAVKHLPENVPSKDFPGFSLHSRVVTCHVMDHPLMSKHRKDTGTEGSSAFSSSTLSE